MKDLKKLVNLTGPAGFENEIGDLMFERFKKSKAVKEVKRDRIGNVYGIIPGKTENKLMVAAHMDEVGFIVSYISDKGFMRFAPLGGYDKKILPNSKVVFRDTKKTVKGVIGLNPPHAGGGDKVLEIKDLFIDTGYDKKELEKLGIKLGSVCVFDTTLDENENVYIGKGFDDRVGCSVLLNIADNIKMKPDFTIVLAATVQEELGLRGGEVAARTIRPDYALIFEGTYSMDTPGNRPDDWTSYFGHGPAITLFDRTMAADRKYIDYIEKIAKKEKIKYQYKQPRNAGGTDAGKIHLMDNGVPCCVMAAPCRYIHSAYTLMHKDDYKAMKKLGVALCTNFKYSDLKKIYGF